jgi:predicted nucleic acid-binding protein
MANVVLDTDVASRIWRDGIAEAYAELSGGAGRGGHTVPANDCWIAACCVTHGIPL